MRIWHLTKTLSGGAGQYALRLSNALRKKGMESTVLVPGGYVPDGAAILIRADSPIRRFVARGFRSLSHRISLQPFHSLLGPEIYRATQSVRAGDIVHLHGMTKWIGVSGLRRLIPPGAKVFWTAHGIWTLSGGCVVYAGCDRFRNDCSACPILRAPWKPLARRELCVKQNFINAYQIYPIANSRWTADRIRESRIFCNVDSIPIIHPIIDNSYFEEDIPDLRRTLGIPDDRNVISMGARSLDDKFKGIPEFLEQLSKTAKLADKMTVLLFGQGTIKISPNLDVRLLGPITDSTELAKVYRSSNIFVSPTKMESFGMTLAEAQAVGTPVAAFDVGGVKDAVHPELHICLEPTNRLENLVNRLDQQFHNNIMRRNPQPFLREWSNHSFSATTMAKAQILAYGIS